MKKPDQKYNRKDQLKAFDRLLTIMDELREQCPWDQKQTMESLRHLTIEETYELSDAIIEKVEQGQFGTVVVGRRGLSVLKELLGGRVGEKIFKLAQHLTVWVVR